MSETTMTGRSPVWAIPVLAVLPLHLVGCDEFFGTSDSGDDDAGDGGADASGDSGGADSDDDRDSDDRDAGSDDDSTSVSPDGGDDDADPILPSNLRARLQPLLDRYCDEALDCGAFATVEECEAYALDGLYEYIPEGVEPTEGCIDAVYSYFDCYTDRLVCDESAIPPEVYSDANCDLQGTNAGLRCR
jgi:hypothetical protein